MRRCIRGLFMVAMLTALGLCTILAAHATTVETEVREFTIDVDGTPAGQYTMTITKQESGILSMRGQASISFKHLLGKYTYSYVGEEHWKDGKLLQLKGTCNDDGKKIEVTATAQNDLLVLKANGFQRNCRGDVWTTTYWLRPDDRFHNKAAPLLDADTGKEFVGQLKQIGREQLMVAGQQQSCEHFRVTGGPTSPCDLWYDAQHRLVRQEFIDQGKRVVFTLNSIRR